jgi:predicted ester cyclase
MKPESAPAIAGNMAGQSGMTRDEVVDFFARRQELFDDLDAAKLAVDYSDDALIESPLAGVHKGPAAAEQALRAVFSAFLDQKLKTERLLIDGDFVAQFVSISGAHVGPFMGLQPTGRRFRLNAVFLFELRDRKIVREQRIYDFTGLMMQIGALKAKPS